MISGHLENNRRNKMLKKYLIIIIICIILLLSFVVEVKERKHILKVHEPKIINAIIQIESSGNPKAVSKKGCIGLMQVNPKIWLETLKKAKIISSKKDLFIPEKNVNSGKFILAHYSYKTNHDLEKTLYLYSGKDKKYPKKVLQEVK